jgi:alpha-tubulin suppressor-like RCC1 family protein
VFNNSIAWVALQVVWGASYYGATGIPEHLTRPGAGAVAIAAGEGHTLVLLSDGTPVAFGSNNYGHGSIPGSLSGARCIGVAAGWTHSMVVLEDGSVVAWGNNEHGQINVPAAARIPGAVVAISSDSSTNVALLANGSVLSWGEENMYSVALPQSVTNTDQVFDQTR